ncbi:MAG: hypothetical protein KDK97_14255 [Verrucomicrobiales bacterium]|nr:hypothetical protein [Verrucomicrobiales bacterium]
MQSHLIPGAPALGDAIGNPPAYPPQPQQPGFSDESFLGASSTPLDPLASITAARDSQAARPRPQFNNRPRRSSSVLMFLVASLLLVGFLGAVGYIFRKPLLDIYASIVKKEAPSEFPPLPSASPAPVSTSTQKPEPVETKMAKVEPVESRPASTGFDPTETVLPASPIPKPMVVDDSVDAAPVGKPSVADSLVEVPTPAAPTPVAAAETASGVKTGSSSTVEVNAPPEAEPALAALKQFLFATDIAQRRPHILGADDPEMVSLVDRYYKVNNPGPIETTNITFMRLDADPETASAPHCVFQVSTKDLSYPIPVMLQGSPTGYKVDWISFIEFKDELLYKFLSKFQDLPGSFHVGISRSHYFEEDVPDRESKDCFRLQPPSANYEGYVFVPKDSPLSTDLRNKISWETETSFVIVELQWRKLGTFQWVEMTGMPQLNWYSAPTK